MHKLLLAGNEAIAASPGWGAIWNTRSGLSEISHNGIFSSRAMPADANYEYYKFLSANSHSSGKYLIPICGHENHLAQYSTYHSIYWKRFGTTSETNAANLNHSNIIALPGDVTSGKIFYWLAVDISAGKLWYSNSSTTWEGGGNPITGASPTNTFTPGADIKIAALNLGRAYSFKGSTIQETPTPTIYGHTHHLACSERAAGIHVNAAITSLLNAGFVAWDSNTFPVPQAEKLTLAGANTTIIRDISLKTTSTTYRLGTVAAVKNSGKFYFELYVYDTGPTWNHLLMIPEGYNLTRTENISTPFANRFPGAYKAALPYVNIGKIVKAAVDLDQGKGWLAASGVESILTQNANSLFPHNFPINVSGTPTFTWTANSALKPAISAINIVGKGGDTYYSPYLLLSKESHFFPPPAGFTAGWPA